MAGDGDLVFVSANPLTATREGAALAEGRLRLAQSGIIPALLLVGCALAMGVLNMCGGMNMRARRWAQVEQRSTVELQRFARLILSKLVVGGGDDLAARLEVLRAQLQHDPDPAAVLEELCKRLKPHQAEGLPQGEIPKQE
jgi:hypothetical protein